MIADHRLGGHAHLLDEAGKTGHDPTTTDGVATIEEHHP